MPIIDFGETARGIWTFDRTDAKRNAEAGNQLSADEHPNSNAERGRDRQCKLSTVAPSALLALLLLSGGNVYAQLAERDAAGPAASRISPTQAGIKYHPPPEAGPTHRIEGSTRGGPAAMLTLNVLTPESIGLTTSAQPTLYWFNSIAVPYPAEVLIIDNQHAEPLVDVKFPKGLPAGIHQLSLLDQGLELEFDTDYRWSVAVIVDPVNRSRDVVASGTIRRVRPSPTLSRSLASANPANEPAVYAENGIWYEALDSASRMIVRSPASQNLRHIRASLLDQVALSEVAAYDRNH